MPGGKYCCVCKNSYNKDPKISLHRFPSAIDKRGPWLEAFGLRVEEVKPHMRVCSRHFPDGDASKPPVVALGKRFCSPIKKDSRAKRAKVREERRSISRLSHSSASTSRSVTPISEQHSCTESSQLPVCNITLVGEQYQPDVTVHELPGE